MVAPLPAAREARHMSATMPFRPPTPPARANANVRALVVDEHSASRLAMRDLLGSIGVTNVQMATEPVRAIRMMEAERFGLVLCEMKFLSQMDGIQVLEYVRTRRLLQPSAAFVLVTSAPDRLTVAATREWQPDAIVLKPVVAESLGPRIEQAMRRRVALASVHEAADRGDSQALLERVQALIREAGTPSLELLRWQANALVDLGRFAQAHEVCEQALAVKSDLPWAELALAHCERAEGRPDAATKRARTLIKAHPYFGGAYDLLIDIHEQDGRVDKALDVAQAALKQLATSRRMRTLGEIAYAHGELEVAEQCYTDLIRKNGASLTRSPLDIGMLGQVFVTQGESDKALRLVSTAHEQLATDSTAGALAASVLSQAHAAKGDGPAAETFARKALALASAAEGPEHVALLVAQGAFNAGLNEEAEALVRQTMAARKSPGVPGALARKVILDAGLKPEAFATAAPAATRPLSSDIQDAMDCLNQARFDDAAAHIDRARERLPKNPMVLLATVQVYMLRMHAKGFNEESAEHVRRCLAEVDRQIPGDNRVF